MAHEKYMSWTGRDDGVGAEHARWFNTIQQFESAGQQAAGSVLIGFASDEGVRRNLGRDGAAEGPGAIRKAMGSFAVNFGQNQDSANLYDAGDIRVETDLESGQQEFAALVAQVQEAGHFTLGLGGGHEITWASYLGLAQTKNLRDLQLGILNIDAHFDNRQADKPSSGTGFFQIAESERSAGRKMKAAAVGIAQQANTRALFDRAEQENLRYLLDNQCGVRQVAQVENFVEEFLAELDVLYLTIDMDVLPAATAPGVSAPAARGVEQEVVEAVLDVVVNSGKLVHADIAELNPRFDVDQRTARVAARFAHLLATGRCGRD